MQPSRMRNRPRLEWDERTMRTQVRLRKDPDQTGGRYLASAK